MKRIWSVGAVITAGLCAFSVAGMEISVDEPGVQIAADEFAAYWRRMTGRESERAEKGTVRFLIDPSLDAVHDEYRVKSADGGLVFSGANARVYRGSAPNDTPPSRRRRTGARPRRAHTGVLSAGVGCGGTVGL